MQKGLRLAALNAGLWITIWYGAAVACAQNANGDVLANGWAQASSAQRISAINSGLRDSSDERRALALDGITLLVAENRDAALGSFTTKSIRPYMLSQNSEVSRTATRAYFAVSETEEQAETDLNGNDNARRNAASSCRLRSLHSP